MVYETSFRSVAIVLYYVDRVKCQPFLILGNHWKGTKKEKCVLINPQRACTKSYSSHFVCLSSVYLSVCLSVSLSVCLSVSG